MGDMVCEDGDQVAKFVTHVPNDNHAFCLGRTIVQVEPLWGGPTPPPASFSHHFWAQDTPQTTT